VVEVSVQVGEKCGLDGHGSARLAIGAARFDSDIICIANGPSVNAKDVMSVMSLRARAGALVRVLAAGPDEAMALKAVSDILEMRDPS